MKIGIVCYPSLGGSGVIATELGHELALRGHEIHFIAYAPPFKLRINHANLFYHEVDIIKYDLFKHSDYALPLAVKIAEVSKKYDLEILHVHYAIPHATSAYLAKQLLGNSHLKIVTTLHGTDITIVGRDRSYLDIVKFSIEQSDLVTAVSQSLKLETEKEFHIQKEIEVIYNFFTPKTKWMGKRSCTKKFISNDEKILIHASNFRPVKRVEDVIKIFDLVQKKIPSKLLLLGSGPELEKAHGMINQFNLEHSVHFLGHNRNIDSYIASSDLFLLPSEKESFGLAALEAMAYGVPVVGTDVGGLPELIKNGVNGFLSPLGHIEEMAENCLKILENSELAKQMCQNNQHQAKENYSADKIVPQYEQAYLKLAAH